MSDIDHEDEFDKAFAGLVEQPATPPVAAPATPGDPTATPAVTPPAPAEEPKKDEQPPAEPPKEEGGENTPPADPAKKPEEGAEPPKAPETPPTPEEPKPLTRDDVTSIISNIRTEERTSAKELETTTKEVLDAYYPDGLSNVLTDTNGRELRTPQDVVDATDGQMTIEQASQWLMNEQYKLDQDLAKIKDDAQKVAETTINFKRDSIAALQKYEPLFKWQPSLQAKVWDQLQKQVKADKDKGVILSAPDVMEHYDFYLEPYQKAFEFANGQPATNPNPAPPEPPKPGAEDRLDEGGDGGASPVNDPNDFAQQVTKELSNPL